MNDRIELPEYAPDAATIGIGSDRYPATVVMREGDVVFVQSDEDKVVSGSGHDGSARYAYYRNREGTIWKFRLNKKGRYDEVVFNKQTKRWNKTGYSGGLYIGRRDRYYDPHF